MSEATERAQRALALDAEATAGPWDPVDNGVGTADVICVADGEMDGAAVSSYLLDEDAILIAAYRTLAPALARDVLALEQALGEQQCQASASIDNCRHCRWLRLKLREKSHERDIALADNAALLASWQQMMERLSEMVEPPAAMCSDCHAIGQVLFFDPSSPYGREFHQPHPGAALRVRMERLEAVARAAHDFMESPGDQISFHTLAPLATALDALNESEVGS